MKKVLLLFAFAAILFSGCKKDGDKPSYSGSFTIDGASYSVTDMMWLEATVELGGSSATAYAISGSNDSETNNLAIQMSTKTTGEKTIAEGTNYVTLTVGDDEYVSISGKINVTKFDSNTASGTFEGQFVKTGTSTTVTGSGKFEAQRLSIGK